MVDFHALVQQLQQSAAQNPEARQALDQLVRKAQSADGQRLARNIPPHCAGQIEQAAMAAQRGDLDTAKSALSDLLGTPEGAALARQLQFLIGK